MTQPDGLLPESAANYSSFAAFAAKTEAEWRADIEDRTTSPFASILGGLFSGLPSGMPQPIALLSVLLERLFGVTLTWSDNPEDFLDALRQVPILGDIIEVMESIILGTGAGATLPAELPFVLGGGSDPLSLFFNNLRSFFTGIDFSSGSFDLADAIDTFQTVVVDPQVKLLVDALTGIVNSTSTDLDNWLLGLLTGTSPLDAGNLFNLEDIGEIAQAKITGLVSALSGTASAIQDVIDTIWQAITSTSDVGNPLAALFDALQNIPSGHVLGLGGPADIADTIQQTWNQLISGFVGTIGSGAGLSDLFNIGQEVSMRATLGSWAFDILGIRSNKPLSMGFLPTSESNIALDKIALQSSAPTFALTQSTAITAYQRIAEGANKAAVSWLGSGVTNITHAFVNIYKMDTTTGLSTLVHASANIVGLLSNTMQHNIYELPDIISVQPGDVFGIEIAVRGAGTHSIAGQSTWLPDHPTVFPRRMSSVRNSGTSAAPSTIAHSSLVYSSNVPFVEFAVSAGDTGIPHSPQTDFFGTVGTVSTPVPLWANTVEVVAVGAGGGGRQGGTFGLCGEGGAAGGWSTGTWVRGTDFTGTPSISVTIAAGGSGGSSGLGYGGNGGNTVVSITGHTVTATGGAGGDVLGASSNLYGRSPGNTVFGGVTYVGGGQQNTSGSAGAPSGGGGSGGNDFAYQHGGPGARGGVWLRFKQ